MASDDVCLVCTEPLQFTAYGPCGHNETCSKCVSRLRSVLKDSRCAYCQQQQPAVFVTRSAGSFTQQLAPEAFEQLDARAKAGELYYLDSAQAYFDDASHYEELRALCSFTHPLGGSDRVFSSLRTLKHHLQTTHKRSFCEICLEGRKVFLAEQIAYTKSELDRHMKQGDLDGAMAESGFKGHPECRFCKKRYYGENELYQHMHTTHEECFICRRGAPHRHVYYRDYPDLENHFRQGHYPCEHPRCLEQKFIVFATEQELRTHTAREHGQTLTKQERKQALTVPVAFNYRRPGEQGEGLPGSTSATNLAAVAASGQRTVVIGGAASVPSQLSGGQQNNRRGGGRGSRPNVAAIEHQQQIAAAMAASTSGAAAGAATDAHYRNSSSQPESAGGAASIGEPSMAHLSLRESEFPSFVAPSAGPAVGGRWVAGGGGPGSQSAINSLQDFPALPGQSKSAKRRSAKKKTAAEVLGGGGSVRVLQSGTCGASGSGTSGLSRQEHFPALGADAVPLTRDTLEDEFQPVVRRNRGPLPRPPSSQEIAEPAPLGPTVAQAAAAAAAARGQKIKNKKQLPPLPGLPGAAAAAGDSSTTVPDPNTSNGRRKSGIDDDASSSSSASFGGISSALRAANRELVAKIKARLGSDEVKFSEFKSKSAAWVKGEITSKAYHSAVSSLGLVSVVPELASTCPDASKRDELLAVHTSAFAAPPLPSNQQQTSWMPPEAAAAGAAHAAKNSSWSCATCTLVNAPAAVICEACGNRKALPGDAPSQWAGGGAGAAGGGGGGSSKPSSAVNCSLRYLKPQKQQHLLPARQRGLRVQKLKVVLVVKRVNNHYLISIKIPKYTLRMCGEILL